MADRFTNFEEAIKQSNEAYAAALSALSRAAQNIGKDVPTSERDRLIENLVRLARMNKDGVITAIEQGFDLWERQVRRLSATAGSETPMNPMEQWAENWRKTTEAMFGASGNEEFRKQTEAVQRAFVEGIRAWQRLWEPDKK
jgi:hypothetical protein